jgi:putative membrane protein
VPHWHAGIWWIFPLVFGVAWLALFGLLIWRLGSGGAGWTRSDPLEILRLRFARGDIDAEEYERRRRVLEGR